jgi:hypothetical protein
LGFIGPDGQRGVGVAGQPPAEHRMVSNHRS